MHNNIMAAGSRDRPPMLATGRYAQWRSWFLRYIDTRANSDDLRKCILEGPYTPTTVVVPAVPATENSPVVPEQTTTAQEMWEAIERLQKQGESLNIQDVKTNLFWEFVATMQVNVQFLQQLQPEWSRFVTIVKQQHKLDEVSYHKLFDILKQYQKEVNELRAEELAKNANPLALLRKVFNFKQSKSDLSSKTRMKIDEQDLEDTLQLHGKDSRRFPNADSWGTDFEPFGNRYNMILTIIDDQNDVECDDELLHLPNLIANLKLDVDENKKIQKQLNKGKYNIDQELTESTSISSRN
ncbi:hypothetical protein Tco_1114356 [Tanacetum coccineum]|uniref:Gag-Pol polyprotein n=1 Tax=Tanacetum coccineum TaxID=301880 RepID=A0ABQ5IXF7_9ASTR